MKVTIVQPFLHWEDRQKNIDHLGQLLSQIGGQTDLIVLPEMFTTGFTMNPEKLAEPSDGPTLAWLKIQAAKKNAVITGSVSVSENNKFYNRLFWVQPDGNFQTYDKRHLFRMAGEQLHYEPGKQKLITTLSSWKFCPLVCYDLRFPVWSRNKFTVSDPEGKNGVWDYDVLIYVANWPEVRNHAWKQLLIARAIENQCYVIGVNRIGADGNKFGHSGDSVVISPRGEVISNIKAGEEAFETVTLDRAYLEEYRKIFPAGLDADDFTIS